jgi:hypothetical protein
MPGTLLRESFREHLRRVEILADAGIPAPREWQALRDRFDAYRSLDMPACDRLIDAVLAPAKTSDVTTWHAQALAEQLGQTMPGIQAQVDQRVAAAVEARLAETWAPHAQNIYDQAADRFNDEARLFTDAANLTDIDTVDPDVVAGMDDDARVAWATSAQHAARLDNLLPVLRVAAELAGIHVDTENGTELVLAVSPLDMRKRDLWAAWMTTTGRCGRWSALTALGAHIRAAGLADIQPYAPPRDVIVRREPIPGAPIGYYRDVTYDPELGERPPEPERTLIAGTRFGAR